MTGEEVHTEIFSVDLLPHMSTTTHFRHMSTQPKKPGPPVSSAAPTSQTSSMKTPSHSPEGPDTMPLFDYDDLDFDSRDEIDAQTAEDARALLTDLPARPGTLR